MDPVFDKYSLISLKDNTFDIETALVDHCRDLLIAVFCGCGEDIRGSRDTPGNVFDQQDFAHSLSRARRGGGIVSDHRRVCDHSLSQCLHRGIADDGSRFIQTDKINVGGFAPDPAHCQFQGIFRCLYFFFIRHAACFFAGL